MITWAWRHCKKMTSSRATVMARGYQPVYCRRCHGYQWTTRAVSGRWIGLKDMVLQLHARTQDNASYWPSDDERLAYSVYTRFVWPPNKMTTIASADDNKHPASNTFSSAGRPVCSRRQGRGTALTYADDGWLCQALHPTIKLNHNAIGLNTERCRSSPLYIANNSRIRRYASDWAIEGDWKCDKDW